MYGARVAVMVSCGAVFISITIGATIGIMSGSTEAGSTSSYIESSTCSRRCHRSSYLL
jgi:ABC-type dipeptide/oligopeptide/nickel transport system permease subunit